MMPGYNLPDDVGPGDPLAPWNQDERDYRNSARQEAIDAVDHLVRALEDLPKPRHWKKEREFLARIKEELLWSMED